MRLVWSATTLRRDAEPAAGFPVLWQATPAPVGVPR
jgi:hypothetical protein